MRHGKKKFGRKSFALILIAIVFRISAVCAQTTSFTYQGRLTDGGSAANGTYDLQFALFDNSSGGTQIGSTLTRSAVAVSGGVFSVSLDFGVSAFPGADRFLEVGVRVSGGGAFTTLSPRQQISSTPYSIRTLSATTADALSSACTACVQDSQINSVAGNKLTGPIPVASVPAGSASYIQNTSSPQSSANFNISGNGTLGGNLLTSGRIGIGPASPLHRLGISGGPPWTGDLWGGAIDLENASAIGWRGNSIGFRFGIGHTNAGLAFFRTASELGTVGVAPNYDFLINNSGNVGIGSPSLVPSLTSKVEIFAQDGLGINGFQPFVTLRDTNAGNKAGFIQGVNGDVVLLTNSRAAMVLKDGTGNVLLGGAPSQHRLNISGGPAWTSNGWAGALSLDNAAAIGWRGNAGGQRFGIGQTTGGLYFFRTFSDPGATGFAANYDLQITDTGNVTQARDKWGLVKAMMLVNQNGTIAQCYNSFLADGGAATPGCGFSATPLNPGTNQRPFYLVNLGFSVTDRFISVTPINAGGNIGYSIDTIIDSQFNVRLWYSDSPRDQGTFAPFYLIVF